MIGKMYKTTKRKIVKILSLHKTITCLLKKKYYHKLLLAT